MHGKVRHQNWARCPASRSFLHEGGKSWWLEYFLPAHATRRPFKPLWYASVSQIKRKTGTKWVSKVNGNKRLVLLVDVPKWDQVW